MNEVSSIRQRLLLALEIENAMNWKQFAKFWKIFIEKTAKGEEMVKVVTSFIFIDGN